jgi:hypothetical protein
MDLSLQELEAAINYWRARMPASGAECTLSTEVALLAPLYALMILRSATCVPVEALDPQVRQLLHTWRTQNAPD